MSREFSKWLVNGIFHLLIDGIYWGYNPLTNLLLTSWDILVLRGVLHVGVDPKIMGKPPNHPFVHRVFHDFHYPFWGFSPYLETPMCLWGSKYLLRRLLHKTK